LSATAAKSDTIAPELLEAYPNLDEAKRQIIAHDAGPLLVIAGPGSGKTFSLVPRAMNLLLLERAKPSEIIVCTFTEKAAFELRERISQKARKVGYKSDLTELRVGTIHSICNRILREFRHRTPLGAGYETLNELTELLTSCSTSATRSSARTPSSAPTSGRRSGERSRGCATTSTRSPRS